MGAFDSIKGKFGTRTAVTASGAQARMEKVIGDAVTSMGDQHLRRADGACLGYTLLASADDHGPGDLADGFVVLGFIRCRIAEMV